MPLLVAHSSWVCWVLIGPKGVVNLTENTVSGEVFFFSFGGQGISILGFLYSDLFCDAKPDEAANGFLSMPACVIG